MNSPSDNFIPPTIRPRTSDTLDHLNEFIDAVVYNTARLNGLEYASVARSALHALIVTAASVSLTLARQRISAEIRQYNRGTDHLSSMPNSVRGVLIGMRHIDRAIETLTNQPPKTAQSPDED